VNVYFLPGVGIYGGIKVGFQFADMLSSCGVKIVVATPNGEAPRWFRASAPVVDRDTALQGLTSDDVAIFSLPHDYAPLKQTRARLVFHCQGTDPLIDPILGDSDVTPLACWPQAADYMIAAGRRPISVGISVSEDFYYDGTRKRPRQVAYMPRRGADLARRCMVAAPDLDFVAIEGRHEKEAASIMKTASYFLATSQKEWFGLPSLEAMAASALVLTVPVLGGRHYMLDQTNGIVADPKDMPAQLAAVSRSGAAALRARLRSGAAATAARYRPGHHWSCLQNVLRTDLAKVLSWN
jgi:hypothetical protein